MRDLPPFEGDADGDAGGIDADDDALTRAALAADPDAPVPADAVPWSVAMATGGDTLLPDWYMPAAGLGASRSSTWRKRVAVGVVASIGLINAAGLCITYGPVTFG